MLTLSKLASPIATSMAAAIVALAGCSSSMDMDHGKTGDGSPPGSVGAASFDYDALFVVNGGDSTISVINTDTNQLKRSRSVNNPRRSHSPLMASTHSWRTAPRTR